MSLFYGDSPLTPEQEARLNQAYQQQQGGATNTPTAPTGNGAFPLPAGQQARLDNLSNDDIMRSIPTGQQPQQGYQPFQATNPFANYGGMGGDNLDSLAMAAGVGGLLGGVPLNQLAAGTLGYAAGNLGIEQARQLPSMLGESAANIANQVGQAAEFRPYAVTTGVGGADYSATGMTQNLSPQAQQVRDSLMQQASTQAGQIGNVTPEQLMQQMTSLRQPEQERKQLELENRLAAQGRLGVQTAAYGGTPEQLAMQKAIQEQQSADSLAAIQGARTLQGMDIDNLKGMLGASGIPQEQLTAALQPSLNMMPYTQRAGDLQAQALSNLSQQGMAGMTDAVNTEALLRQAQMESILTGLGVNQRGGMVSGSTGGSSASNGFNLEDLINWGRGLFSDEYDPNKNGSNYTESYNNPDYDYEGDGFGDSGFGGTGGI